MGRKEGLHRMGLRRTNYATELSTQDIGKVVTVCGWVHRYRDLGHLLFVDLRDRSGLIQLTFSDQTDLNVFRVAYTLRAEFVIAARGIVQERETTNKELETGKIEIAVSELEILGRSKTPPFEISDGATVKEELRLHYRYLDLRRSDNTKRMISRHRIVKVARDYFDEEGFIEIETPMLIRSTPEGARDYLVPSRIFKGQFFALPQSPQLYKQLTMLAGFDRYMQIARCFRDEDLRADRQPEFTQIDFEMSFVDQEDVMQIAEGLISRVYKTVLGVDLSLPFERMSYDTAMNSYGSDKPDLRFGLCLHDLSSYVGDTSFRVFKEPIMRGGTVRGLNIKGGTQKFARKDIDRLVARSKELGLHGLCYTRIQTDGSSSSSYEKFLTEREIFDIRGELNAENGDLLLIAAADDRLTALESLGCLRVEIAKELGIINESENRFVWIVDFPLVEFAADENRFVAKHHPFTSPNPRDLPLLATEPSRVRALAYDLVLNGNEIGGGSLRIHEPELQKQMLALLGFSEEEAMKRFGFLIEAFQYGAPPHGGMAFGLDRLVMLLLGCDSIREVIAFPKAANSSEPMTGAPGDVDESQLRELSLMVDQNSHGRNGK